MKKLALVTATICSVSLPATAQGIRDTLRMGIQAYDDFNEDRAIPLLRRGLNPNGGPTDSLWAVGLHKYVQVLMDRQMGDAASRWLLWAFRYAPDLETDPSFPPGVISAFEDARSRVAEMGTGNTVASTAWVWTPSDSTEPGQLVYAEADSSVQMTVVVVGFGVIQADSTIELPPGTYDIQATADGYESAVVRREVLAGITTSIRLRLRDLNPGLVYIASEPWGAVYIDDERIGYTTLSAYPLPSGEHQVRIVRQGYAPFDTTITIQRRERLRLGTVRLVSQGGRQ